MAAKKTHPQLPTNKNHKFYMRCWRALKRGLPLPSIAQFRAERKARRAALPVAGAGAEARVKPRRHFQRTSGVKATEHGRSAFTKYVEWGGMCYSTGGMTPRRGGQF